MHGDAILERPPTLILVAGPPTCAAPALGGAAPDAPAPAAALDAPTIIAPAVDAPAVEAPALEPPQLRCVICHDDLAAGAARRCPGCRTLSHPECLAELGRSRCATLGCSGRRQSPVVPAAERPVSRVERRSLWLLVPAVFTLLATGVVSALVGLLAAYTNRGHHFAAGPLLAAVVAAAVHLLLLPGAWCAALRGRGFLDGLRTAGLYAALLLPPTALLIALVGDDPQFFYPLAGMAEPIVATLIVGIATRLEGGRAPARPTQPATARVRVRARPLAFATA